MKSFNKMAILTVGESHLNWFRGREAPSVGGRHNSSILIICSSAPEISRYVKEVAPDCTVTKGLTMNKHTALVEKDFGERITTSHRFQNWFSNLFSNLRTFTHRETAEHKRAGRFSMKWQLPVCVHSRHEAIDFVSLATARVPYPLS